MVGHNRAISVHFFPKSLGKHDLRFRKTISYRALEIHNVIGKGTNRNNGSPPHPFLFSQNIGRKVPGSAALAFDSEIAVPDEEPKLVQRGGSVDGEELSVVGVLQ